VKKIQAADLF